MARIYPAAAVGTITGLLGNTVYQRGRTGPIVRANTVAKHRASFNPHVGNYAFGYIARRWSALSTANKLAWQNYASGLPKLNTPFGSLKNPTGYQCFMTLNIARKQCNPTSSSTSAPPTRPYAWQPFQAPITYTFGQFHAAFVGPDVLNNYRRVWAYSPASPARAFDVHKLEIVFQAQNSTNPDTATWTPALGYWYIACQLVEAAKGQQSPLLVMGLFQAT